MRSKVAGGRGRWWPRSLGPYSICLAEKSSVASQVNPFLKTDERTPGNFFPSSLVMIYLDFFLQTSPGRCWSVLSLTRLISSPFEKGVLMGNWRQTHESTSHISTSFSLLRFVLSHQQALLRGFDLRCHRVGKPTHRTISEAHVILIFSEHLTSEKRHSYILLSIVIADFFHTRLKVMNMRWMDTWETSRTVDHLQIGKNEWEEQ